MSDNNIHYIDKLKGFAILGVIICHFAQCYTPENIFANRICELGGSFPQLFFVISAFLLWRSFDANNHQQYVHYITHKIERIFPPYYVVLFACLILFHKDCSVLCICSHIILLNGLFPSYLNNIFIEWYVTDLFMFMLIAPLIYKYVDSLKKSILAWIIAVAVNLSFFFACEYFFKNNELIWYHDFNLLNQLPTLMCGVFAYYFLKSVKNKKYSNLFICTLFCVSLIACAIYIKLRFRGGPFCTLKGLLFLSLFLIVAKMMPNLKLQVLSFFGTKSYGLYLVHVPILWIIYEYVNSYHGNILLWIALLSILIILSLLVGTVVEKYYPFCKHLIFSKKQ